jgi:hypothetical protein
MGDFTHRPRDSLGTDDTTRLLLNPSIDVARAGPGAQIGDDTRRVTAADLAPTP